jgi:hypothetical protein
MAYFIMLRRFDFADVCIKRYAAIKILWFFNANKPKNRYPGRRMGVGSQSRQFNSPLEFYATPRVVDFCIFVYKVLIWQNCKFLFGEENIFLLTGLT